MKAIQISVLLFGIISGTMAQNGFIDSLRMNLKYHPERDSAYILSLLQAGHYFEPVHLDTSAMYYEEALALSRSLPSLFLEGKTISWYTDVLNKQGHLKKAAALNRRGIEIGRLLGHDRLWAASLSNMANTFQYTSQYDSCLRYQLQALPVLETLGDTVFLGTAYNNISGTYQELRQFEKARTFALMGLKLNHRIGHTPGSIACYFSLGITENQAGRKTEALSYFQEALRLAKAERLTYEEGVACLNIAEQYQELAAPDQAVPWIQKGIDLMESIGEKEILARLLVLGGDILLDLGRTDEAEIYLHQALDTAHMYSLPAITWKACESLSYHSLVTGDRNAYRTWRDSASTLADALLREKVLEATSRWEIEYETARKDEALLRMQQLQEISILKVKNRNILILGMVGVMLLSASAGYLWFLNTARKKKLMEQTSRLQQQMIRELEQEKQLAVSDALLKGQERERSRLAKDLHDGLGGMLSGIKQSLSSMKGNQIISETGVYALNQVIRDMDQSIQELRHIARNMMPEALIRFGLPDALQDYAAHMEQSTGMKVAFQSMGVEHRLDSQTEIIIFRIAQELLNNAVKHSGAEHAMVQLMQNAKTISLSVEDDGKGMDPSTLNQTTGSGWSNIRSRVDYLHGHIDIRTKPGEGVSVHIEFVSE